MRIGAGIDELTRDGAKQPEGMSKGVPAIPTQETAQVDAETAQQERTRNDGPTARPSPFLFDNRVDVPKRQKAQQRASTGAGEQHRQEKPERHRRARPQVNEVGQKIRRVWKKEQPQQKARARQNRAMALHGRRKSPAPYQRNGRQKKVPQQSNRQPIGSQMNPKTDECRAPQPEKANYSQWLFFFR